MVTALNMGWRHVLFANWSVDSDLLNAHLPSTLTIDTYDGDAWLSVVPFTNVDVRSTWVPEGWGFHSRNSTSGHTCPMTATAACTSSVSTPKAF
jgi:uncharacterized protein YqjF (DUF2071 family)